jgi:hypothetical protein
MRRWPLALVLVVMGSVALAIGVIVVATSSSRTALLDLEVGDCFDFPTTESGSGSASMVIELVDVISCTTPHEAEVVADGTLNDDRDREYPTDDVLFAEVDRRCRAADVAVGDGFGILPIAPTEDSWGPRRGRFLCVAVAYGGVDTSVPIGTA